MSVQYLACFVKISEDNILNIFLFITQKIGLTFYAFVSLGDTLYNIFAGKNKKNINLLSAEYAQRVVKVNINRKLPLSSAY